jgi:hypothetical protein
MSMTEIKEHITALTADERAELAALISYLNRRDDPEHHAELARRLDEMEAGQKISQPAVEALHDRLMREGG